MATHDVNDSKVPSYYLNLPPETRASLAAEMFAEIYEHNEGLEALLSATVDRVETLKDREPTLWHLVKVAMDWATLPDHIGQIYRLRACLAAMNTPEVAAEA